MRPAAAFAPFLLLVLALAGCLGGGSKSKAGDGPTAEFSPHPAQPLVGDLVRFTDQSHGSIVNWSWDFGDGEGSWDQHPTHAYALPGTYVVRLEVRDGGGRSATASSSLVVGERDGASPAFSLDFSYALNGRTVEFTPHVEPDRVALSAVRWDFGDGGTSADHAPSHTYAADGVYVVILRAAAQGTVQTVTHPVPVGAAAASRTGLGAASWVVIAVVDSGINAYHEEFRDSRFTVAPSTYIQGYPADARRLDLTLTSGSYATATKADESAWKGVKARALYWIPGTRIVGASSFSAQADAHRILDDDGHGTATASIAAGKALGACANCLLVALEGLTEGGSGSEPQDALAWAMAQPWIDIVTNSWTVCLATCTADTGLYPPGVSGNVASLTKSAVESGKTVLFAAGNGVLNAFDAPTTTYENALAGPDWVVTVGAADSTSGATVVGTGRPFDITSYGLNWRGASGSSTTGVQSFSGTSAATPLAAGVFGYALQAARSSLGDVQEGPHARAVLATGTPPPGTPTSAALGDGTLTRRELESAVYHTALAASGQGPLFPASLPSSPASAAYAGWGLVNAASAQDALAVLSGQKPMPARPDAEQWAAQDSAVRRAIWGAWDPGP